MNQLLPRLLASIVGLSLILPASVHAEDIAPLGQHTVQYGETLYCLGRAYHVPPAAIAQASGLSPSAGLRIGQVLTIPALPWTSVPAGRVCSAQFVSPFVDGAAVPTAPPPETIQPTATPPTQPTPAAATLQTTYTIQRGDTLYFISRRFGISLTALMQANGLTSSWIYSGQVLRIPGATINSTAAADIASPISSGCPEGCVVSPPSCVIKGNVSIDTGEKIYHLPGGQFYETTIIRPEYGERWFCSEAEALANGWRKSER